MEEGKETPEVLPIRSSIPKKKSSLSTRRKQSNDEMSVQTEMFSHDGFSKRQAKILNRPTIAESMASTYSNERQSGANSGIYSPTLSFISERSNTVSNPQNLLPKPSVPTAIHTLASNPTVSTDDPVAMADELIRLRMEVEARESEIEQVKANIVNFSLTQGKKQIRAFKFEGRGSRRSRVDDLIVIINEERNRTKRYQKLVVVLVFICLIFILAFTITLRRYRSSL